MKASTSHPQENARVLKITLFCFSKIPLNNSNFPKVMHFLPVFPDHSGFFTRFFHNFFMVNGLTRHKSEMKKF